MASSFKAFAIFVLLSVVLSIATANSSMNFRNAIQPVIEDEREKMMDAIGQLSDEQLQEKLSSMLNEPRFRSNIEYDPCLLEAVKRGGMEWEGFLLHELEELEQTEFKISETHTEQGDVKTLELLTAVRRVQKQDDPFQIIVEPFDEGNLTPISLPTIEVRLKNTDDKEIGFQTGGNYRSGRQTRWRVELTDDSGTVLPVIKPMMGIDGGLSSESKMKSGQEWETELILNQIVEAPKPGKYSLQVHYHNSQAIFYESSLKGFVTSKSQPIDIEIHPLTIELTETESAEIEELINQLDPDSLPHILVGEYGQWAADFLDAETPQAKLLGYGPKAIPGLVDRLQQADSIQFRSHILAILFSITGCNDPRNDKLLGEFKFLVDAWGMKNSVQVNQHSGRANRGSIDAELQQKFVERWVEWRDNCVKISGE